MSAGATRFELTILFIGGTLEGLTYTYETDRARPVGHEVSHPYGNTSPYRVIACLPMVEAA